METIWRFSQLRRHRGLVAAARIQLLFLASLVLHAAAQGAGVTTVMCCLCIMHP